MTARHWRTLAPFLDQALNVGTARLSEVRLRLQAQRPELLPHFDTLLRSHQQLQSQDFLQGAPASSAGLFAAPQAGQRLGPYTLMQPIGEGGMGCVWLARRDDGRYQAQVALKFLNLPFSSAANAERFRREGQILAQLDHPHIARLLDASATPAGQLYLVLEHVQGHRIDLHCRQAQLGLQARLRLFLDLLDAVTHAHQHLVVHRDIKPANVLVTADGQLKLLDFGIAKLLDGHQDGAGDLTALAGNMLTPGYAAREQLQGGAITMATDVYALGVLLFELLAGQHPTLKPGATLADAVQGNLQGPAPRLSARAQADTALGTAAQLRRQFRGDLDNIVAKALQPEAAMRYATAADFAQDLRRHLAHQPVLARAPRLGYRLGKFLRRQRLPVALAMAAVLGLATLGTLTWQERQAAQASQAQAQSVDGLLQSLFHGMSPDVAANRNFSARELLDRASAFLEGSARVDGQTRRNAALRMAVLYRDVGAYDEAAKIWLAEIEAAGRAGEAVPLGMALWNLANVQLKSPRGYDAAGATLERLRALLVSQPQPGSDLEARRQLLHAEWLLEVRDARTAAPEFEAAERGLAERATPSLELLARAANDRAEVARQLGELKAARAHLERAVALQARRGEPAMVDLLDAQVELGRLLNWEGRFDEAASTLASAHAKLVGRLGEHATTSLWAANELATAQLRRGRFDEVRKLAAQLASAQGPDAVWRRADAGRLQALVALYSGQADQAAPLLAQLLAQAEAADGGPSPRTEPLRRMHAQALLAQGRNALAEAELQRSETHLLRLTQANNASAAASRLLLGCAQARRGDLALARQSWAEALSRLGGEPGSGHPFWLVAASYAALADATVPQHQREVLARRLEEELGWQRGAPDLAAWLRGSGKAIAWAQLPAVL